MRGEENKVVRRRVSNKFLVFDRNPKIIGDGTGPGRAGLSSCDWIRSPARDDRS